MAEFDYPEDLRYTPEHEWVRAGDEASVRVGITAYAQDALGDVVFVTPPSVGDRVSAGASGSGGFAAPASGKGSGG